MSRVEKISSYLIREFNRVEFDGSESHRREMRGQTWGQRPDPL